MKSYRIILSIILIVGLTAFFSPSSAKAPKKSTTESKLTETSSQMDSKKKNAAQPIKMEFVKKDGKLFLKLNRTVSGVWVNEKKTGVKSIGKGKLIEVTSYLTKAKKGKLTFVVTDAAGKIHKQQLPVSRYASLIKPDKPKSIEKKKATQMDKDLPKKGAKRITPQPMVTPPAKLIVPTPDLKVEDLKYVANHSSKKVGVKKAADSYISFLVKNVGKGKIDRRDFNKIGLSVKIGGRQDSAYKKLSQVLRYNQIKEPGGEQRCEIPKRLEGRTRVEVDVNANNAVDESWKKRSRKENNRASMLLGDPLLLKSLVIRQKGFDGKKSSKQLKVKESSALVDKKLKKASKSITGAKMGKNVIIGKSDKGLGVKPGQMNMRAKLNLPEGEVPEPVPLSLDYGIQIVEPRREQEPRRGTAIRLMYRVTNWEEAEAGDIIFSLHPYGNQNEEPLVSTSNGYTPPGPMQPLGQLHLIYWTLPIDIPVHENYIIVARLNDDIYGVSDHFAIRHLVDPVDVNLSGRETGLRVQLPEGGETFRPGGTLTCRWGYTSSQHPGNIDIRLIRDCEYNLPSIPLEVESGNPDNPNSNSVLRIPEDIGEGLHCLAVRASEAVDLFGFSRAFEIRQPSGVFGEGTTTQAEPELRVITPGSGGEHWRAENVHQIKWRFHPGLTGTIPGTWTITLLRWNPSTGYSVARSFTPDRYDLRQVNQRGLNWWEHTIDWSVPADFSNGEYKVRVRGMGYQDEGSLNFTIGSGRFGWNLWLRDLKIQNTDLVALIKNTGGISGRLDFTVEVGDVVKQVTASAPPQTDNPLGEPVVLGHLHNLADDLSQFDCGIPVKVTVDSTDRVDETNEGDNEHEEQLYMSMVPLSISLLRSNGNALYHGAPVLCNVSESDNRTIALIKLKNCGSISRNGRIRVAHSGYWSDSIPGTLDGHTEIRWHDEEIIVDRNPYVHPGDTVNIQIQKRHLRRNYRGQIVDSNIIVYFEGDFADYVTHSSFPLWLDVQD